MTRGTKGPSAGIDYRPQGRGNIHLRGMNKRAIELERNMHARMIARAQIHAVKMQNRSNSTALKHKSAHYIAAFTGKPFTVADLQSMIFESSATANLADGLKANGA